MNKTRIMVDALIERVKSDQRWRARDWKETVLRACKYRCVLIYDRIIIVYRSPYSRDG